jgi:hypothetical protein
MRIVEFGVAAFSISCFCANSPKDEKKSVKTTTICMQKKRTLFIPKM